MGKERADLKILIVDDEERALKLLESRLLQLGFRTIIKARRGMEALDLARMHLPDLIFLDIMMPGLDGGAVRGRLREDPKTKDIPAIFLSAILRKEEQKRLGSSTGGDIILAKPYSTEELSEAIDKALGI